MSNTNTNSIRGHSCEGLIRFQENSTYSCIPSFNEDGSISGCDGTNEILVEFCPFCGEYLKEVKIHEYTCKDCDEKWIQYDYEADECIECYSKNITETTNKRGV